MPRMCAVAFKGSVSIVGFCVLLMSAYLPPSSSHPAVIIECAIRATPEQGVLRLDATARGHQPAQGNYRFEIAKNSSTGTSSNVQSGAFNLKADRPTIITTAFLDGSAIGHYRAKLILETDFGSVSCVSP